MDLNLTKDQIARLKEMDERRQEMIRQNRRNHENDTLNNYHERRHEDGRYPQVEMAPNHGHDTTSLHDNK